MGRRTPVLVRSPAAFPKKTCGVTVIKVHQRSVFFGESVPAAVVADAWALFAEAEVLLVLGSSLAVFSGYRFVHRAAKQGLPVGIVNLGESRGDRDAAVRLHAPLSAVMPILAESLLAGTGRPAR